MKPEIQQAELQLQEECESLIRRSIVLQNRCAEQSSYIRWLLQSAEAATKHASSLIEETRKGKNRLGNTLLSQ